MMELKEGICCLCKHPLSSHINETYKDGWRCHVLSDDLYQCECFLRKGIWKFDISYYDLKKRIKQHKREMFPSRKQPVAKRYGAGALPDKSDKSEENLTFC